MRLPADTPTPSGTRARGFDVHAHWFGTDLEVTEVAPDPRWPRLVVDSEDRGRLMLGAQHYRDVRPTLWDVRSRLDDLDAAGIDTQVVSPVPVTFAAWAARGPATAYARAVNGSISAAVRASGGRLLGLGALPLPHVRESVAELETVMATPGMVGVEIGARIGDAELDDPRLRPFFEAAEDLGAAILVHPVEGGGGTLRRTGQPYDLGLGMLTDTALAAGALVFGGVLDAHPALRVVLAHGCGSFPWAYPRMRLAATLLQGRDGPRLDELAGSLFADTLVLDPEHLRLVAHRFGAERLVLGTDHPFFPAVTLGARTFLDDAESSGALAAGQADDVFSKHGRGWAGAAVVTAGSGPR